MSTKINHVPFNIIDSLASNKRRKNQIKKNNNEQNFSENKENISNNISPKLYKEDDISLKELKSKTKNEKIKDHPHKKHEILSIPVKPAKPISLSKNDYNKYTQ